MISLTKEYFEAEAAKAAFHIQLSIEQVTHSGQDGCVTGRVERVFRGPPSMLGTRISLALNVCGGPEQIPINEGGRFFKLDHLVAGKIIETFLDDLPSGPKPKPWLTELYDTLTEVPHLSFAPYPSAPRRT
jgi:hypothetical protein